MSTIAEASIEIAAPLDAVWRHMTDLSRYGAWNTFVVAVEGASLDVGAALGLRVRWDDGREDRVTVTVTRVDAPSTDADGTRRAAVVYRFTSGLATLGLLRSERTQSVTQPPGGPTRYETREVFTGPMQVFVPRAKVTRGFERHARSLKARAESQG